MKKSVKMTVAACACAAVLAFGMAGCGSSAANNTNTNNTNSNASASVSTNTNTNASNATNTNTTTATTNTTAATVVADDDDESTGSSVEYKSVTNTSITAGEDGSIEYSVAQATSDGVTSYNYEKFVELMEGTVDMDKTLAEIRSAMGCNGTLMTSSKYPANTYAWYTADKVDCILCSFDGTSDSSKVVALETTVE